MFNNMLDSGIYFVSGIDTDAGKSYATGWLAANWDSVTDGALDAMTSRSRVITQKLIQTGCAPDKISEDIVTHRRLMGTGLLSEDLDHTTCALRFAYPASPHLAAAMERRTIDLSLADRATEKLLERYDTVLIEGAGGLMVPIKSDYYMIDYAAERGLPLILVTSARLGSLNHTLLSLEACRTRGVRVSLVAYNLWGANSTFITDDTRNYLVRYLKKHHPECDFIDIPVL